MMEVGGGRCDGGAHRGTQQQEPEKEAVPEKTVDPRHEEHLDILCVADSLGLDWFELYAMEVTKWPARVNQAFRAKGREIHPDT